METLRKFFEFELISVGENKIRVYTLVTILIIFLITKLILWLIKKALYRKRKIKKLDKGSAYAIFQIIRYVIWVIAVGIILETIGVKVTVLIAGSAALLVGVGLGLQQTFNDTISGIILLSEQSIKIDDVLEIDGDVVKIQSIGLRTSKGLNTDDISIIIPNSLITTNKVINWSHQTKKTRFSIDVGVAGGADSSSVVPIGVSKKLAALLLALSKAKTFGQKMKLISKLRPADLAPVPPSVKEYSTGLTMGQNAEQMARDHGISRQAQDELAHRSHTLAAKAWQDGLLDDEVMTAYVPPFKQSLSKDNTVRFNSTLEGYAKLRPAFDKKHGTSTREL